MSNGGGKGLFLSIIVLFLFFQVLVEGPLHDGKQLPDVKRDVNGAVGSFLGPKINCNFACARRCISASRKNVCARACGTCCLRCQCVPAGTSGNVNVCPCYANLKTHGQKPKCP